MVPAALALPSPVTSVVLKVAAGCNLDCDYCYEYRYGDDSWKRKPAGVSDEVVDLLGWRIREHAQEWGLRSFGVSLHGGEPMLVGAPRLASIAARLRAAVGDAVHLDFGMQTNGTLLDEEAVRILANACITMGVSLDGDAGSNDAHRVDKKGRGTHAAAARGIEALTRVAPDWFGGILCVVNVHASPRAVFEHLASFEPPLIDFLLPHGSWDRLPPAKESVDDTRYGAWLCEAFDAWFDGSLRRVSIRYFESILAGLLGGPSSTEAIGAGAVGLVTIATDGAVEGVDTMKSVYPGAQRLGVGLGLTSLSAVLHTEHMKARQVGLDGLCAECRACPLAKACGGGYFPHRYGRGRQFENPSVYCADIKLLCSHIASVARATVRNAP